ncbi:hypothetical protein [Vibrio hepatarius]|uniref:hypothetical protein n=1 Tax=Vibrio hepatarius TaxID=171383 RepID=UPI001C091BF3|nr:hypothetical protein [Vibrio hepatarius]MBU2895804.1 hypothetical protein [Vibrio hepatarius]
MKTIPLLFTVLLSVFAWTTNQVVSSLENSPILEITSQRYDDKTGKLTYLLTNVSGNKLFKDLTFEIYSETLSCQGEQEVILMPPNMKNPKTRKPKCSSLQSVEFEVSEIHPHSSVKLVANVKLKNSLDSSALYVKSDKPIKIIPKDVQTSLIQNKLCIFTVLFGIWIIFIVIYICISKKDWLNATG